MFLLKIFFINSINRAIKSLAGVYVNIAEHFIYTIIKLHFRKILYIELNCFLKK